MKLFLSRPLMMIYDFEDIDLRYSTVEFFYFLSATMFDHQSVYFFTLEFSNLLMF